MNDHSQSTLTFVALAPMKHPRLRPRLHRAGARVVVSGGDAPPEEYDFATDRWAPFEGSLPGPLPPYSGLGGFDEYADWGRDDYVRSRNTGGLTLARHEHAAALLPDGSVFVAGGYHDEAPTAHVELGFPPGLIVAVAPRVKAALAERERATAHTYVRAMLKQQDFADAERVARSACERWPMHQATWTHLADALDGLGRPALDARQRAVELAPDCPFAWSALGDALAGSGADSLAAFTKALELALPEPTWCHAVISHARAGISRELNNRGEHARSLEVDPKNAWAHYNLACALLAQGKRRAGLAAARRAMKSDEPELRAKARALVHERPFTNPPK